MKKLSEIVDYYYGELAPTIKELDKKRDEVKRKTLSYFLVVAFFITLGTLFVLKSSTNPQYGMTAVVYGMLLVGAYGVIMGFLSKDYVKEFKNKVIAPLIRYIDPNLQYDPNRYIPKTLFERSGIVRERIDYYSGNDYVHGAIEGVEIVFSDIVAERRTQDSEGNEERERVFEGVLLRAEFPKRFLHTTFVLPDSAEKHFGSYLGNILQSHNSYGKLIKMDNPKFEKEFVVYGQDSVETHYILTQSMMERILEFRKKVGHSVALSFVGGEMFLAVHYNKDTLEPSIFGSLLDYKIAKEYIETLYYALGIVEELKLNQKLWSKR